MSSSQSTLGALDLQSIEVNPEPFPFAIKEDFLGADLYAALKSTFPDCPSGSGPTAHNLYWGDPAFDKLLARHDCWREFFEAVNCQAFLDRIIPVFGSYYERERCLLDTK